MAEVLQCIFMSKELTRENKRDKKGEGIRKERR